MESMVFGLFLAALVVALALSVVAAVFRDGARWQHAADLRWLQARADQLAASAAEPCGESAAAAAWRAGTRQQASAVRDCASQLPPPGRA